MMITVDTRSPVPPYEQVRAQISDMIAGGALTSGQKLPSVRQLAGDLGIANGTVARAYRELEVLGQVTTHGRHGTAVAGNVPVPSTSFKRQRLAEAAAAFVAAARAVGASDDEMLAAVGHAER